jgi:pimeloyl-ACP methyl ester carboxylesterase
MHVDLEQRSRPRAGDAARERLLAPMPVVVRRLQLAGISTAVLEGGDGPPVVLLRELGVPAIPSADLARIAAPTTLIWGRYDRVLRLRIGEAASARYGWPLHVIENAGNEPNLEQPEAFLEALRPSLAP